MDEHNNLSVIVTIRTNPATKALVEHLAEAAGMTVSTYLNRLIESAERNTVEPLPADADGRRKHREGE